MVDHEWRERTDDGTRLFCATRFGKQWKLKSKLKSDEDWTWLEPPFPEDVLVSLRDVLWAKYQRRKLAFETVREIDTLLPAGRRLTTDEKHGGLVPRS